MARQPPNNLEGEDLPPAPSAGKAEYTLKLENVISSSPDGTYQLYFTDSRFVLLKTQPRSSSWSAGGGLLGAAIASGVDRARKKTYDPNLTLEEMVRLDKDNYTIPYDRISRITRSKGLLGGGKEVEVHCTDERGNVRKVKYNFGNNFRTFYNAVSSIALLQGKVDPALQELLKGK